jgi:peptide/nickel transport system permease protein
VRLLAWLGPRLASTLLTVWVAATLSFFALRLLPGDAFAARLASSGASPNQIAARVEQLGLAQPPLAQYTAFMAALMRGDLGVSLLSGRPVGQMLAEQWPATLTLALASAVVMLVVAWVLASASQSQRPLIRRVARLVMALLLAMPVYWLGLLLIFIFSLALRWLPSAGNSSDPRFLILPACTLGLSAAGGLARLASERLARLAQQPFALTARAKGLPNPKILRRHLLPVGAPPLLNLAALQLGFLLGGTALTEMLFVRPGVGQLMLNAINDRDYPVVQAVVIVSAALYSGLLLLADLLSYSLDPRQRAEVD